MASGASTSSEIGPGGNWREDPKRQRIQRFMLLVLFVSLARNGPLARGEDQPANARELLGPVIAALRDIQHPRSGRGAGIVKIQEKEQHHVHRFAFRFKDEHLSRTDFFDIRDVNCANRRFGWAIGREAYVAHDESHARIQKEPAETFHHAIGYDFHPATFLNVRNEPLADTLQSWVDGKAALAVDFDDNGLVEIRFEQQEIQGKDDDHVLRQVLVLDEAIGYRPLLFLHAWSYCKSDRRGSGTETRLSWVQRGQSWYITDARCKSLEVGPYVEGEPPNVTDAGQRSVRVDIHDLVLDVDIPDSEFALEGLDLPDNHRVLDRMRDMDYRYTAASDAGNRAGMSPEQPDSDKAIEVAKEAGPWDNFGKPAASLDKLQWVKGGPVSIEMGSVYILAFWSTWVTQSWGTIPRLTELQRDYRDRGVTVIGIAPELGDDIQPFVEAKGDAMDYVVAADPNRAVSAGYMDAFNVAVIPHAFIVGKDGTVLWHGHPAEKVEAVLEEILAADFDATPYVRARTNEAREWARLDELLEKYFALLGKDDYRVKQLGQQIVADTHASAGILNLFAWRILAGVRADNQDLELAQRASARAVELSGAEDGAILDTYALALYLMGKKYVSEAITHQQRAIELTENDQMRETMEATLERYQSASLD